MDSGWDGCPDSVFQALEIRETQTRQGSGPSLEVHPYACCLVSKVAMDWVFVPEKSWPEHIAVATTMFQRL